MPVKRVPVVVVVVVAVVAGRPGGCTPGWCHSWLCQGASALSAHQIRVV